MFILSQAYGPLTGFLFGWAYFLVVNTGGIAALSIAFATYLGYFIPLGPSGTQGVAICGLILVTVLNIRGVRTGGIFSDAFTILKLAGIAGLILVGFSMGSGGTTDFSMPLPDIFPRVSERLSVVTLVYLLANLAYLFLLPPSEIASSSRLASDAVSKVLGSPGGSLVALVIFLSTFGSVGIYTLTAPRIYFAMASDGVFFKRVAEVHLRFQTPALAIVVQSAWAIVLILFWGTFDKLISYVVFTDWIFFGLTGASVFIFRRRNPELRRPYKTFGYPFTPAIFVGVSAWFVVNTLLEQPAQAAAGLGFLALGIGVYYYWKR